MTDITPLTYALANRRALIRMLEETPEQYVIDRMSLAAMLDKTNMEIASIEAGQYDDDLKPCYGTRDQVAKRNRKLTRRCQRLREENKRLRELLLEYAPVEAYRHSAVTTYASTYYSDVWDEYQKVLAEIRKQETDDND